MLTHLKRDLEDLKREILTVGAMVEQAVDRAIAAVVNRSADMAREVLGGDARIDDREVQLEESVLKVLALHQPVAHDLRFLVAVMKVNNDLERMGDHACAISRRAIRLCDLPPLGYALPIAEMGNKVRTMLSGTLQALVSLEVERAHDVCHADDSVDEMHRLIFDRIEALIEENPRLTKAALSNLTVSRHLERIADLATNVAEDVIFMVEGRVVRHRIE